jgi:predicted nucleic acid-binding protein
VILDSSAVSSFFFKDSFTDKISEIILNSNEDFETLDLAFAEVSNVAWKRIIIFQDDKSAVLGQLQKAIDFIEKLCRVIQVREVWSGAIDLAINERLPFYDSAFLYLAIRENSKLLTTDLRFFNKLPDKYKKFVITP